MILVSTVLGLAGELVRGVFDLVWYILATVLTFGNYPDIHLQ